jgi:peptidyl-prolyl cis-trans isomerase B (cyclophilin B)
MTRRNTRLGIVLLLMLSIIMVASACGAKGGAGGNNTQGGGTATTTPTETPTEAPTEAPTASGPELLGSDKHPVVTIELSNDQTIKLELYPEVAPNTVNNFISLVQKGFYDGLIFHRVIPGFMIQGGDPDGNGAGGPGYSIKGEFTANGFENKLLHTRGVLSMARRSQPLDSAGSQFFIMVADAPSLDDQYASFGKVTEGMEAVDEIVNAPTGASDRPTDPISMTKVTVDTLGMTFEEPEKVQ